MTVFLFVGFGSGSGPSGFTPPDIYVSEINGNDANDGLTPLTPKRTIIGAEAILPDVLNAACTIHVGRFDLTQTGQYVWPTFRARTMQFPLIVIGDGASQAGAAGEEFVEILASTAALAGSSANAVISAALGANAFRGYTIEILTGAAAGDRRTVRNNTATDIVPTTPFSAAVADGDTYRIVAPTVRIDVPDTANTPELVVCQAGYGAPDLHPTSREADLSLYMINLQLVPTAVSGSVGLRLRGSSVVWLGIYLESSATIGVDLDDASLTIGLNAADTRRTAGVYGLTALGATTSSMWLGWGIGTRGAVSGTSGVQTFRAGVTDGYVVFDRAASFRDGSIFNLRGGSIAGLAASTAALLVTNLANGYIIGPSSALPFLITAAQTAAGNAAITCTQGGRISFAFYRVEAAGAAGESAFGALLDGLIEVSTGGTLTATGYSFLAFRRGQIVIANAVFAAWPGSGTLGDLSVDNHSPTPRTVLATLGDSASSTDGSSIIRN